MGRHHIYFALKMHHLNIGTTLTSLRYLTDDLEEAIKARQSELDIRYAQLEKELQDEDYDAYNVLEDEIEQHFKFNPRVMFSSMFLQLYSFFEFELVGICATLSRYTTEKFDVPRQDVLKRCHKYLQQFIDLSGYAKQWNESLHTRDLRNSLMHENGILSDEFSKQSSFQFLLKKGYIEVNRTFQQVQIKNRQFVDDMIVQMQGFLIAICTLLDQSEVLKSKLNI